MVNRAGVAASRFPAPRGLPPEGLQPLTHCHQGSTMIATTDVVNVRTDPRTPAPERLLPSDEGDHAKWAIGKANRKDGERRGLSSR
jgi:hypothetical protein